MKNFIGSAHISKLIVLLSAIFVILSLTNFLFIKIPVHQIILDAERKIGDDTLREQAIEEKIKTFYEKNKYSIWFLKISIVCISIVIAIGFFIRNRSLLRKLWVVIIYILFAAGPVLPIFCLSLWAYRKYFHKLYLEFNEYRQTIRK